MCGIFGQVSNDASKINIDKISILGIMNETRGTSSCGLFINDDIYTGVGVMSKFRDFIPYHRNTEITTPVVIGHTRQASVGVISEKNAHPFGFGLNKSQNYTFIGAHNGTLHNYEEIAEKRDINLKPTITVKEVVTSRSKIDSEVLLEAIYKDNNFSVLEEYNGGAALAMFDVNKNTVMLYSGASAKSTYSTEVVEERPLHVYIVDQNTFYFSSESEPLEAIAGYEEAEMIKKVPFNQVLIITDGDYTNAEVIEIDRSRVFQSKSIQNIGNYRRQSSIPVRNSSRRDMAYYEQFEEELDYSPSRTVTRSTNSRVRTLNSKVTKVEVSKKDLSESYTAATEFVSEPYSRFGKVVIHGVAANGETCILGDVNKYGDIPFQKNLRFLKKNDENINVFLTGVFIHVFGYGLIQVGMTVKEAFHFYRDNKEKVINLYTGQIETHTNQPTGMVRELFAPTVKSVKDLPMLYFYKGYLLKEKSDYMMCINPETESVIMENHTKKTISTVRISHMTVFPVKSSTGFYFKDGVLASDPGVRHPLLEYTYTFVKGHITRLEIEHPFNYNLYVHDLRRTILDDAFTETDERMLISKICGSMAHPIFDEKGDLTEDKPSDNDIPSLLEINALTEIIENFDKLTNSHDFYYQLGLIIASTKVDLTSIINLIDVHIEQENDDLNNNINKSNSLELDDIYLLISLKKSLINYKKNN